MIKMQSLIEISSVSSKKSRHSSQYSVSVSSMLPQILDREENDDDDDDFGAKN